MKRIVSFFACFVFFLITIAAAQQAGPSDISIIAPNCGLRAAMHQPHNGFSLRMSET
jgi:hypothetical protein